jgi:hypothetical protein
MGGYNIGSMVVNDWVKPQQGQRGAIGGGGGGGGKL